MKTLILLLICASSLVFFVGCQTSDQASRAEEKSDVMAAGQKCSQCDCKEYSPGRLIKGVCNNCGHTAEEHSGTAK